MIDTSRDPNIKRLTGEKERLQRDNAELAKKIIGLEQMTLRESQSLRDRLERERLELERRHKSEMDMHDMRFKNEKKRLTDQQAKNEMLLKQADDQIRRITEKLEHDYELELQNKKTD